VNFTAPLFSSQAGQLLATQHQGQRFIDTQSLMSSGMMDDSSLEMGGSMMFQSTQDSKFDADVLAGSLADNSSAAARGKKRTRKQREVGGSFQKVRFSSSSMRDPSQYTQASQNWNNRRALHADRSARTASRLGKRETVRVYRTYRAGDLPDVQITNADLILPLQALHVDPIISRDLLLLLFRGVYEKLDAETKSSLHEKVTTMLERKDLSAGSSSFHPPSGPFVYILLRGCQICCEDDDDFAGNISRKELMECVGGSALATRNYHAGKYECVHI
jgi:hypothetical protein